MLLRDVELTDTDIDAYVAMRCDPAMMAELGGPQPREGIEPKVAKDAHDAAADKSWIKMIALDEDHPENVAGTVTLWRNSHGDGEFSEIGWMVLPGHQGKGVGKQAVAQILDAARADGRWGAIHAFPGVDNAASNGICRSLGFTLLGEEEIEFAGRPFVSNHWVYDAGAEVAGEAEGAGDAGSGL